MRGGENKGMMERSEKARMVVVVATAGFVMSRSVRLIQVECCCHLSRACSSPS